MKQKLLRFSFALSACVFFSGIASAQLLYHTDFTGTNGTRPADWEFVTDPYESTNIQNDALRVLRPAMPSGAGLRTTVVFDGIDLNDGSPYDWANYTVLTRLQGSNFTITANNLLQGVVARFVDEENPGYTASIQAGRIEIFRNPTSLQNNAGTILQSSDLTQSLANNTWYWLQFTVSGNNLSASVYLDDGGEVGNSIGFVSVVDSNYSTGTAGIRVGLTGTNDRSVTYDNFSVIPEPSTYAAMAGGVVLLLAFARRRLKASGN